MTGKRRVEFNIIFLVVIIPFFSCNKNDLQGDLNGSWISGSNYNVHQPIMYLQNQKITDTSIIYNFLRERNAIGSFDLETSVYIPDTLMTVYFGAHDIVNFKPKNYNQFIAARRFNFPDGDIVIRSFDSVITLIDLSTTTILDPPSRCDTIVQFARRTFPISFYYSTVLSFNLIRRVHFGGILLNYKGGQLRGFTSNFYSSTNTPHIICQKYFHGSSNWFIPSGNNIEEQLGPNDTVVFQIKEVPFERIN